MSLEENVSVLDKIKGIADLNQYLKLLEDDEDFVTDLLKYYDYIVKIFVKKYKIMDYEQEDVLQEGRMGMFRAIESFVPNKGNKLVSYMSLCAERSIISYIRNKNRKKRQQENLNISLEKVQGLALHDKLHSQVNVEETVINEIFYQNILNEVNQTLEPIEAKVYGQYVQGYTIAELSKSYQVPKKKIYIIVAKARKKIGDKLSQC
jgi:RNA polymerase sporulation-specific sigma factor